MDIIMHGTEKNKNTKGNVTVDIGQVIRNIKGVETNEKKQSFLQKIMEPEEVNDKEKETKKALNIAKKIARGQSVTPEEKAFLMRVDPQLLQMAEQARKEYERVKHALEHATSKSEQQSIVQQAYQMVTQVSKKNPQFGMLLGEAVKAAVQDSKKHILPEEDETPKISDDGMESGLLDANSMDNVSYSERNEQDALLEQFFPEEYASMMDCRS